MQKFNNKFSIIKVIRVAVCISIVCGWYVCHRYVVRCANHVEQKDIANFII